MAPLPHFLNLDLILKSNSDFTSFIDHLDERAFVLQHQKHEQQFLLALELNDEGQSEDAGWCTQQFLAIIEALPDAARKLWDRCISRTFSYGFESGREHPALDATITADLLLRIAKLDADVGITVYPCQPNNEPSDAPRAEAT